MGARSNMSLSEFSDRYWSEVLPWVLGVLWLMWVFIRGSEVEFVIFLGAAVNMAFVLFAIGSIRNDERLIDLPWKKGWVWWLLIMTAPLSVPCFLASFISWRIAVYRARKIERAADHERERLRGSATAPKDVDGTERPLDADLLAKWIGVRSQWRAAAIKEQIDRARGQVQWFTTELVAKGEEMGKLHQGRIENLQRLRELEGLTCEGDVSAREVEWFRDECYRIRYMPGVEHFVIENGWIVVYTHPVIVKIDAKYYDIGDWRIEINTEPGSTETCVLCVRITRKDGTGVHPYSLGDCTEGRICYGGERNAQLYQLERRGEYAAMISIIMECLPMVNSGDKKKITDHYSEIPKDAAEKLIAARGK